MGWTLIHPDDLYAYADTKSGMRRLRRPALAHALEMVQQDKVDVIVCLKLARIDRKPARRIWAMEVAEQFGGEFRFVNHPETRGKLPEGEMAYLQRAFEDTFDEREAKEIVERLAPGMDGAIGETRARLDALNAAREQAEAERTTALPVRTRATERVAFLRQLFTVRDSYFDFTDLTAPVGVVETGDPHLEIGWPGVRTGKHGEHIRTSHLPLHQAAALLDITEEEIDLPIERGEPFTYTLDDGTEVADETVDTVDTADVIYYLLKWIPCDRLRKLLEDLEVIVLISRPRSRAEWAARGATPITERVSLQLLGTVMVRADGYNLTRLSQVTNVMGSLSSPLDLSSPG